MPDPRVSQSVASVSGPEFIARAFHEAYESLAPMVGYETRRESAVPWDDVPPANRRLMVKTVTRLLHAGVIEHGPNGWRPPMGDVFEQMRANEGGQLSTDV